MVYTHVHRQVTFVRKRAGTDRAAERFLTRVAAHVHHQVALVVEGGRADRAAERLFSSVGPHVDNQALLVLEPPRADVARVGLLTRMLIDMLHQGRFTVRGKRAEVAIQSCYCRRNRRAVGQLVPERSNVQLPRSLHQGAAVLVLYHDRSRTAHGVRPVLERCNRGLVESAALMSVAMR